MKGPKFHINQEVMISIQKQWGSRMICMERICYIKAYFFNDTNFDDCHRDNKRAFRYLIVGYGKDNEYSTEFWEDEITINREFKFKH